MPQRLRGLAWMMVPAAAYLFVLQRLWFNAPVWDDYDAILDSVMHLQDAGSAREWLAVLVGQHNEHRIAVMRLTARILAALGPIDFRLVMLVGNLTLFGIVVLAWLEFRDAVEPALFAAAGFLGLQWSYYQASVMASAALPNIGVVFFAFACLFFALREGRASAAWCIVFALLAAGSQANGLFALPLAAVACALARKRERAIVFAVVSVALWATYFIRYAPNPGHPSPMEAFRHPLVAAQLFLVVLGGIVPGRWPATVAGVAVLAALAWLASRRVWKTWPVPTLWIVFVVGSAATATIGRAGFGVFHASRYAIYSTALVVLAFLLFCALTRPWKRAAVAGAVALSAIACVALSWAIWPMVLDHSLKGRLLAKPVADAAEGLPAFVGMMHPSEPWATRILRSAEARGLYAAPAARLYPPAVRVEAALAGDPALGGHLDQAAAAAGERVTLSGWSHLPATVAQRAFVVIAAEPAASVVEFRNVPRQDVAMALQRPDLMFSGFRLVLAYPDAEAARRAAGALCVTAEAPGMTRGLLVDPRGGCRALRAGS